jgi:hypothetical protein
MQGSPIGFPFHTFSIRHTVFFSPSFNIGFVGVETHNAPHATSTVFKVCFPTNGKLRMYFRRKLIFHVAKLVILSGTPKEYRLLIMSAKRLSLPPFEDSKENDQMPGSGHLVIIDS